MTAFVDILVADPSDFNGGKPVSATNPLPVTIVGQQAGASGPAGAALDGTDGTGITPPTGAVGIRGWLSGIFAGIGVPSDTAWASGPGTMVALLKALVAAIKGTLTIALPTGAATDATLGGKLDALNTGMTAADAALGAPADVAWASGSGSLVALFKAVVASLKGTLKVDGSAVTQPVSLTNAGQYNSIPPLYTNGQASALQTDANGRLLASITSLPGTNYKTVAASLATQILGTNGAIGDLLNGLLIIPATTSPGAVTVFDNTTSVVAFPGGTVPSVIPFFIPVGATSLNGAWKVTTGANVSVVAVGRFT